MIKHSIRLILVLSASFLLFACAGEKLDLKVKARMDGQPAAQAKVAVDGKDLGVTDADGTFSQVIRKKPGAEVEVTVAKDMPGYRITPWKSTFVMKLPKSGVVDTYSFDADLAATHYITIVAAEKGTPVPDAVVAASGKEAGKTDAKGEFVYEYKDLPQGGVDLTLTKSGYGVWRKTGAVEPGQRIEAALSKRVLLSVTALAEEYGQANGIPGVVVTLDKKQIGKTDARGTMTYRYDGEPGRKAQIALSASGYIPATWKTSVTLEGEIAFQRYFYPTTPKPIRAGIYRFVGNTPNVDMKDILSQVESALDAQLFKNACFRKVPTETLRAEVKRTRVSIEKLTARGWRETPLRRTVDMIILGSVAKDEKGYLIETKFYTSGGKLILSQITRARSAGDIKGAAREITANVLERFPFEGTVIGSEGDRFRVNIGKAYKISRGTEFALMAARLDESGKVSSYRDIGKLKVKRSEDAGSWAETEDLRKGEKVAVGDRVVRHIYREGEEEGAAKNYFVLLAKGGVPPDVSPLGGVNIYLNEDWIGTTGADGKAEVPVRVGKKYDIMLYRHGYQQVSGTVKVDKNKDTREFVLQVNNSVFRIESEPEGADVFVDGDKIGTTPIRGDGKLVNLGFHTVKVSIGGDYRDWEEVVEFAQKVEDRTGEQRIVLHKDYLKMGERAEQKGDVDGAIQAYQSTEKGHPDYSEAHSRLGQLYLDDKNDYDAAIREFENVLSLPENQQLLYKQYAVTYTNLGHAYYEKGSALVQKDKNAAAQCFAKAIENLKTAKQNTRFFPTVHYDEAVHDTYYYTALSYHKLYLITKKDAILNDANLAWQEYFDFFPKNLEGNSTFEQNRETAQKYWDQIKNP
jgi:tetratricopeptide (TPR) repeat protein